jgi:hypothetical protein
MGHPLTLVGLMEMYPTQDACRRAHLEQRRREGFRGPRCAHALAWYLRGRGPCEGGRGRAHLHLIDDAGAKTLTKAAGAQIRPGGAVRSDGCSASRAPFGAAYLPRAARRAHEQAAGELLPSAAHRHPPTSSVGDSTSALASAPRTCSPTSASSHGYLSRLPSPALLPIVLSLEANPDFNILWLVELNGYPLSPFISHSFV